MAGEFLTRARAAQAMRMAAVAIVLFLGGGAALLMAPAPQDAPPSDVARVAPRLPQAPTDWYPPYAFFAGERGSPFETGREPAAPPPPLLVKLPEPPQEMAPPPPPPPPPRPNTQGLQLVGTAPGSQGGFAIFTDQHNGLTFVAAEGEQVRNAELRRVLADRVILALDEQEAEIELPPIRGGR